MLGTINKSELQNLSAKTNKTDAHKFIYISSLL